MGEQLFDPVAFALRIRLRMAEQDRRIAAGIRVLADEMGCTFLREEAARAMVMGDSKMEVR